MEPIGYQKPIVNLITQGESWDDIINIADKTLKIDSKYLTDVMETIKFLDTIKALTPIDSLFIEVCLNSYKRFPYRSSGHLYERLYTLPEPNTSNIRLPPEYFDNDSYAKIARLSISGKHLHLTELISYLHNDSATRLIIHGIDWDDIPFYLSISDIAMELIEILTYCDFFDNASQSYLLFSNSEDSTKQEIINNVTDWYKATQSLSTTESILYFLDRYTDTGHSYTYTCNNLRFLGDSALAQAKLDERAILWECSFKVADDAFLADNHEDCIKTLLEWDNYRYKDSHLSTLIRTNLYRNLGRSEADQRHYWHKLFSLIANYAQGDILKTLISLMKIKSIVIETEIEGKETWNSRYPSQYSNKFRVCDFALLKFNEIIKPLGIADWMDKDERDSMIKKLITEYGD